MKRRITIKDIAEIAGVSISSVHIALSDKPGVSEETRENIKLIAKKHGYRPNTVAASLKRKTIKIAAAFPGPTEDDRFYYTHVWEGVRDYMRTRLDYNIEFIEVQYYSGLNSQADELTDLLQHTKIDGLLTLGHTDYRGKLSIKQFVEKDIPVVLVGTDLAQSGRLCCVQPNYQIIGKVMAELMSFRAQENDIIMFCAGDASIPSHYLIAQGFDSYFKEKNIKNQVYKIHSSQSNYDDYKKMVRTFKELDISAACSVNARSSVSLGQALIELKIAGKIPVIGSDLFQENFDYLRGGIFTHLIQKNPYLQSYLAAKYLVEYILLGIQPPDDVVNVGSEIVLQSNLSMYENEQYKLLY